MHGMVWCVWMGDPASKQSRDYEQAPRFEGHITLRQGVFMSSITSPRNRFFISNGHGYDLECLAEGLTREIWEEEAKIMALTESLPLAISLQLGVAVTTKLVAPSNGTRKLSPKEARIAAIFGGTAVDETTMNLRVALTNHFLKTGRSALPEMTKLLVDGMDAHLMNSKPWGRPNLKPSVGYVQKCLVIAIDKKFHKKRKCIGKALGISAGGVRQQIRRTVIDEEQLIDISLFEESLPENLDNCLVLLRNMGKQNMFAGLFMKKHHVSFHSDGISISNMGQVTTCGFCSEIVLVSHEVSSKVLKGATNEEFYRYLNR